MQRIFVDTVAWIALLNTRDSLHSKSRELFADLRGRESRFVTSEFVLIEFANALSAPQFRGKAAHFIEGLRTSNDVEIHRASSMLFDRGLDLYRSRTDKEWSLVDCISFVLMNEQSLSERSPKIITLNRRDSFRFCERAGADAACKILASG